MKTLKIILTLILILYHSIDAFSKEKLTTEFISKATLLYVDQTNTESYVLIIRNAYDQHTLSVTYKIGDDEGNFRANLSNMDLNINRVGNDIKSVEICATYDDATIRLIFTTKFDNAIEIKYQEKTVNDKSYDESFVTSCQSIGFSENSGYYNTNLIYTSNVSQCMAYIVQFFREVKYPNKSYELSNFWDNSEQYDSDILRKCKYVYLYFPDTEGIYKRLQIARYHNLIYVTLEPFDYKANGFVCHSARSDIMYVRRYNDKISLTSTIQSNDSFEISVSLDKNGLKTYNISFFAEDKRYEFKVDNVEYCDKDYEPKTRLKENMYSNTFTLLNFLDSMLKSGKFKINYK